EREARTAAAGDIVASGKLQGATAAIAGNLTAGSVNTNTLTAIGLGSTPLNADQLVTGTVPDARIASNIVRYPLPPATIAAHASTHLAGGSAPAHLCAVPGPARG